MTWSEGYSSIDNHVVYHQKWSIEKKPLARVLLIHGVGEHSSRYAHVGEFFNSAGIELTGFDLLGHGKTDGQRGHAESYDEFCREVAFFVEGLTSSQPSVPVFLYGHSMGGLITLYYILNYKPANIKGIICTSPGLVPGYPIPAWKTALGNILYSLVPRFSMDNGLPLDGLSHDKTVIDTYKADPLTHPKISARMGMDLIRNGLIISRRASELYLPLLLMVGSADTLVNPEAVKEFGEQGSEYTTLKIWENGYHELHNEPYKNEVLNTMVDWIVDHVK